MKIIYGACGYVYSIQIYQYHFKFILFKYSIFNLCTLLFYKFHVIVNVRKLDQRVIKLVEFILLIWANEINFQLSGCTFFRGIRFVQYRKIFYLKFCKRIYKKMHVKLYAFIFHSQCSLDSYINSLIAMASIIEQWSGNFVNQQRIAIILRKPLNVMVLQTVLWRIIESSGCSLQLIILS